MSFLYRDNSRFDPSPGLTTGNKLTFDFDIGQNQNEDNIMKTYHSDEHLLNRRGTLRQHPNVTVLHTFGSFCAGCSLSVNWCFVNDKLSFCCYKLVMTMQHKF